MAKKDTSRFTDDIPIKKIENYKPTEEKINDAEFRQGQSAAKQRKQRNMSKTLSWLRGYDSIEQKE